MATTSRTIQGRRRPSRRSGCLVDLLLALVVLGGLFGIAATLHPPLLLNSVDAARALVGPAPVAHVETAAFRVGTLWRRARVAMGDTAPRWQLEITPLPTRPRPAPAGAAATAALTASPAPSPAPTATVAPSPSPVPTAAPSLTSAAVVVTISTAVPTPPPSPEPSPSPAPEPTPAGPTATPAMRTILRGGNLRSEPRLGDDTLLGLLWPGDRVAVYEQRAVGATSWLRVQLEQPAPGRGGQGVAAGAGGWISALLLSPPPPPTPTPGGPTAPPAAPQPRPTARPIQFQPLPPTGARQDWPPPPLGALIDDGQLPGEGQWQLVGTAGDGGDARLAVTALRPDPARPDIQVAVVAVDMTRAQLHAVAGLEEPPVISGTLRYGAVPQDVQQSGLLLAAFNGGFKAIHGADGMAADGEVYARPVPGRATLGIMRDGSLRLGVWGRDLGPADDLAAWRQNGRLLVEGGAVTDAARQGGLGWGASVDLQAETWRSGVGLSADGRTLLYAVGDALTAARLAEVLRAAGAASALQLDINNYWVRFVTFQRDDQGRLFAQALISAMPREPRKYLAADKRDFFYLTAR